MAIDNPALWAIMKLGARNAMISTAEKAGIPWRKARQELHNNAEVSLPASLLLLPKLAAVCTKQSYMHNISSALHVGQHAQAAPQFTPAKTLHALTCSISMSASLFIPPCIPADLNL